MKSLPNPYNREDVCHCHERAQGPCNREGSMLPLLKLFHIYSLHIRCQEKGLLNKTPTINKKTQSGSRQQSKPTKTQSAPAPPRVQRPPLKPAKRAFFTFVDYLSADTLYNRPSSTAPRHCTSHCTHIHASVVCLSHVDLGKRCRPQLGTQYAVTATAH